MKILHISTFDIIGGAARAAYRLHSGLLKLGHESRMFVAQRASDDPNVTEFRLPRDLLARIRRRLRRMRWRQDFGQYRASRPTGYELFSDTRTQHDGALVDQLPKCDVVNLHW